MPLHIQIVDANGHPDPVSNLADVLVEAVVAKGVGLFRTQNHVAEDLRAAINETIRSGVVVVHPPSMVTCPGCHLPVGVWHVYPDGSITCTSCKLPVDE